MIKQDSGFSMIELLVVILIIGIVLAFAIPQATTGMRDYRLHADASDIAAQLNVARMRAASQYAPYRLVVNIDAGTYWMEKLCGLTTAAQDASCTSAYASFTNPVIEGGAQVIGTNDSYASCRPSGVSVYPGSISADPGSCTGSLSIYFNTRGSPVVSGGGPLTSGGAVLYLTNSSGMVDAVTVNIGGGVVIYQWSKSTTTWSAR